MDTQAIVNQMSGLLDRVEQLSATKLAEFERAANIIAGAVERAEQEGCFKGWRPWQVAVFLGNVVVQLSEAVPDP